jgi:hypothetical protein
MDKLKLSFLDIHKNNQYKEAIIDALTGGITDEYMEYYEMVMNYIINEKYNLFDKEELKGSLYKDEDDILDLILPSVRRVFGKVFINPPEVFEVNPKISSIKGYKDDGRMELFRLQYDIDEFIDYLLIMIEKSKDCLSIFDNIDKTSKTLELIVDNYISGLISKVMKSDDIKVDIRDLKLKNMIK